MEYMHIKKICLYCVQYFDAEKLEAHFDEKHFCGFCDIPVPSIARHKHTYESRRCRYCDKVITHFCWKEHFLKTHFKKSFVNEALTYRCLRCEESFKIYDELRKHILKNHRGKPISGLKSNTKKRKKEQE